MRSLSPAQVIAKGDALLVGLPSGCLCQSGGQLRIPAVGLIVQQVQITLALFKVWQDRQRLAFSTADVVRAALAQGVGQDNAG